MARLAISLFVLVLALANLLAATRFSFWLDREAVRHLAILDPARSTATSPGQTNTPPRDLALREALRAWFGWGRYRDQDPKTRDLFREAYWDTVTLDGACVALGKQELTIEVIVWGGNFAKVQFHETGRILQINFWGMRREGVRPENPTGWRFSAHLSLVENKGLGL